MFLNSKSFESSEGANKCYNSKFVLWICTSYQLNGSKASTFIVYFSQLCVFNSLVQTMIKTRCAHGHWSPECTSSLHIVTHGVTKQEDACSHCLTRSNPRGDHTLHGYCGKCSFDKSTAADGRWVKPSNTPEINLWPLRQWSITQQAVGHPRSIRVAIHPSNGIPLRASRKCRCLVVDTLVTLSSKHRARPAKSGTTMKTRKNFPRAKSVSDVCRSVHFTSVSSSLTLIILLNVLLFKNS